MENWRQFINEKLLPYGDPLKRKTTKKRFEAALGRSVRNGEVIALDKRFHQIFKIAAQMKVWLATRDTNGQARLYDDMKEACKWARISCPSPEPKEEPQEEPEPEEEPEEEEEAEYQQIRYRGKYGFETDPRTGRAAY